MKPDRQLTTARMHAAEAERIAMLLKAEKVEGDGAEAPPAAE